MNPSILQATAKAMVAPGKGILAIDESQPTCKKRFDALGLVCDVETRREYRELLVTAPEIEKYVSGYIIFDETLRQKTTQNVPFPAVLEAKGILPGIKVDAGVKELALHPHEKIAEGLDGLRERMAEYKQLGAEFAKWRAVITIGKELPSAACTEANTHALARYAAIMQEADIVPMVEPEILIDGDHSIDRCYEVSVTVWKSLFRQLKEQGVWLPGVILKTSMILSGKEAKVQADVKEVALKTVKGLKECVPKELAGVVFLSGGQSDAHSTIHLNAMNQLGEKLPWPLSFSYGRGIQRPALETWAKNRRAVAEAQKKLVFRAKMNALAAEGKYSEEMEKSNG